MLLPQGATIVCLRVVAIVPVAFDEEEAESCAEETDPPLPRASASPLFILAASIYFMQTTLLSCEWTRAHFHQFSYFFLAMLFVCSHWFQSPLLLLSIDMCFFLLGGLMARWSQCLYEMFS